jgi:hypothetical protein
MQDRLRAVGDMAAEHVSPDKVRDMAGSFLKEAALFPDEFMTEQVAAMRMTDALGYAIDLALFTPSPSGQTAVDRARRSGKYRLPEDIEAAGLLSSAVFRLIELGEDVGGGLFRARDLASNETTTIFDPKMSLHEGRRWALRGCLFEDIVIAIGPVTQLSESMLNATQPFIVPGRGLKNPLRCAETLYRHFLRQSDPFDGIKADALKEAAFPFDAEDGGIHAIAARWAAQERLPEPTAEETKSLRRESYPPPVFEALCGLDAAHKLKMPHHAAAYERVLLIQLETIHRRSSLGIRAGHESLDSLAASISKDIASSDIPHEASGLFADLCRKAKLAASSRNTDNANRDELEKVLGRIQALRSKTVDQGCTEEEALTAATKVAELLDRYGLSLSEIDFKEQRCSGESMETDRRRQGPLDECVGTIAAFCDCRTWYEMTPSGTLRHIFFGLPADVAGARCLYEKVDKAFVTETRAFKRSALYDDHHTSQRRSATTSFQAGLGHGICTKLNKLKVDRTTASLKTTGRDLVPIKRDLIEDELSELGLNLTAKAVHGNKVLAQAYNTGRITGENLEWDKKIDAA